MKKRMTLLLTLIAAIALVAGFTLANAWQDHQGGHHSQDHTHHQNRPMELNTIMRLLMLDVHTINEGIFTQNFDLIASGAESITDHPQLSEKTVTLLEETLGDQLSVFEEFDHTAHMYADSIRQAADEENLNRVLGYYRSMEQSCVACHAVFQDPLRMARLNSR